MRPRRTESNSPGRKTTKFNKVIAQRSALLFAAESHEQARNTPGGEERLGDFLQSSKPPPVLAPGAHQPIAGEGGGLLGEEIHILRRRAPCLAIARVAGGPRRTGGVP